MTIYVVFRENSCFQTIGTLSGEHYIFISLFLYLQAMSDETSENKYFSIQPCLRFLLVFLCLSVFYFYLVFNYS